MKGNRFILHSEGIDRIRNEIINVAFLASCIFGTFSFYGSIMRVVKTGYDPIIIFYSFLFASIWAVYLFRKQLSVNWKAGIFFILFFLSGTFLNLSNGIISGALHYIFVSTIITLLYGWRLGAISIILSVITRTTIAILYYKGILVYEYNLNEIALSPPLLLSTILGALFTASVIVFAINKFYHWLLHTLESVTEKVKELEKANIELEIAKTKAIENDRLKTVFLANMSHEIRTPMNAIIGFASLLGKANLDDIKRTRYTALVQNRSYDLLKIIEDILDISKIETGELKVRYSVTDLQATLQEILEIYSLKLKDAEIKKEIEISLKIDETVKNRKLQIDNLRLKQVLNNLVENAIKFTEKGTIEIGCSINNQINFYVRDSGIGIPPDKQKIIFDRFRQADESATIRQYGGTGLGLSICKGLLDLMEGEIYLKSEKGTGSTFYFSVPLIESEKAEMTDQKIIKN